MWLLASTVTFSALDSFSHTHSPHPAAAVAADVRVLPLPGKLRGSGRVRDLEVSGDGKGALPGLRGATRAASPLEL